MASIAEGLAKMFKGRSAEAAAPARPDGPSPEGAKPEPWEAMPLAELMRSREPMFLRAAAFADMLEGERFAEAAAELDLRPGLARMPMLPRALAKAGEAHSLALWRCGAGSAEHIAACLLRPARASSWRPEGFDRLCARLFELGLSVEGAWSRHPLLDGAPGARRAPMSAAAMICAQIPSDALVNGASAGARESMALASIGASAAKRAGNLAAIEAFLDEQRRSDPKLFGLGRVEAAAREARVGLEAGEIARSSREPESLRQKAPRRI